MFLFKEKGMARLLYIPGHTTKFSLFLWGSRKKKWEKHRQNLYHPWMAAYGSSEKLAPRLLFCLQSISSQLITAHTLVHRPPTSSSFRSPPKFLQDLICTSTCPCYRFLMIQLSASCILKGNFSVFGKKDLPQTRPEKAIFQVLKCINV